MPHRQDPRRPQCNSRRSQRAIDHQIVNIPDKKNARNDSKPLQRHGGGLRALMPREIRKINSTHTRAGVCVTTPSRNSNMEITMDDRGSCRPERIAHNGRSAIMRRSLQRFFQATNRLFQLFIRWRDKRHTQRRMVWLIAAEKFARDKYYAVT